MANCCPAGGGTCTDESDLCYGDAECCGYGCTDVNDGCYGDVECCGAGGGGGGGGGGSACYQWWDCPGCQICSGGTCVDDNQFCMYPDTCNDATCGYIPEDDPLALDLDGTFTLTNPENGVKFDFFGTGKRTQISWTAPGATVAWLVLDLNRNGRIDNGFEMFSNITKQPTLGPNSLGFTALAEYDKPENGGNGDGIIDARDQVFSRLRLWQDKNHDGITQPTELISLAQAGISSIDLKYQEHSWTDAYGNQFRYRAKVTFAGHGQGGQDHWAYDVIPQGTK